jgi:hypothetical protein
MKDMEQAERSAAVSDIEQALAEAWNVHEAIAWHVDPYHLCSRHRCLLDILATEPMQAIARDAAVGQAARELAEDLRWALAVIPRRLGL